MVGATLSAEHIIEQTIARQPTGFADLPKEHDKLDITSGWLYARQNRLNTLISDEVVLASLFGQELV